MSDTVQKGGTVQCLTTSVFMKERAYDRDLLLKVAVFRSVTPFRSARETTKPLELELLQLEHYSKV